MTKYDVVVNGSTINSKPLTLKESEKLAKKNKESQIIKIWHKPKTTER